eukprot:TRINITY_DN6355_c0_g1::TRINITY_DN6355_c0_g1_i1::g.563::m.563 TRINITY_DN6355_c0_g1::TRINITY_DN6355_c0_g1_i1::g.563  ORF type:complete len:368 (-),score=91.39,sp/O88496/VKGC_RAT/40.77/3e-54,VKG_Carbox/PF05090.9/3.5e-44,DUF4622/PF15415.1/0.076 TRINITY_DN6355_c0_g1_i1:570-1673(-)
MFLLLLYGTVQLILPYSHSITQGYNTWGGGLYGYSWDMMIHKWATQHVRVEVVDRAGNNTIYLNPEYNVLGRKRWNAHPDMIVQYGQCMADHVKQHMNISDPAIYLDVWRSMNRRFQQRLVNPTVDITRASWNPFTPSDWINPVLTQWDDMRTELADVAREYWDKSRKRALFVADFPGYKLENYVNSEEFDYVGFKLMSGEVRLHVVEKNATVVPKINEELPLPRGTTHVVETIGTTPATWTYLYVDALNEWTRQEPGTVKYIETEEDMLTAIKQGMLELLLFPGEYPCLSDKCLMYMKEWNEAAATLADIVPVARLALAATPYEFSRDLAIRFNVSSFPAAVVIKNGYVKDYKFYIPFEQSDTFTS